MRQMVLLMPLTRRFNWLSWGWAAAGGASRSRSTTVNGALPLLEKVGIATVSIHSQIPHSHPSVAMGLGPDRRGTGTLVSADGLIVTVNYMVIGAENVMVTFTDGRQAPARVVARDFTTSLGVLQVEGNKHPHLEVTSS